MRGNPSKPEFIYKNLYILTCLNFSHLQSALHLMQCTYWHILVPFSASVMLCFTFSTSAKYFPLRTFFIQGNKRKQTKVAWGETGWIVRVGHGGHDSFGQKLLNTQHGVGRYAHKSQIMKWANALKKSFKKFTKAEHNLSQQCQLVHSYRWVPRTLTSQGKVYYSGLPSTQNSIFGVPPVAHLTKRSYKEFNHIFLQLVELHIVSVS